MSVDKEISLLNFKLEKENDDGNVEYKREIIDMEKNENKYGVQMIYRLREGGGVAYYYLGVNDDGSFYKWDREVRYKSLENFVKIVKNLKIEIVYILKFNTGYKIKLFSKEYCNDFI